MISPFFVAREESGGRELFAEKIRSNAKTEKKDPFASFLYSRCENADGSQEAAEKETATVPASSGGVSVLLRALVNASEEEIEEQDDNLGKTPLNQDSPDDAGIAAALSDEEADGAEDAEIVKMSGDEGLLYGAGNDGIQDAGTKPPAENLGRLDGESPNEKEMPKIENSPAPAGVSPENPIKHENSSPFSETSARYQAEVDGGDENTPEENAVYVGAAEKEDRPDGAFKRSAPGEKDPSPRQSGEKVWEEPQVQLAREDGRPKEAAVPAAQTEARTTTGRPEAGAPESDREAVPSPKIEAKEGQSLINAGRDGGSSGTRGDDKDSSHSRHDNPGISLISRGQDQRSEGLRPGALAPSAGFSRELELAGKGGAALEEGVGNVVTFMRTEGRHRASIIVDPPALGRIEVELVSGTAGVEASIRVGSEQLKQLVQDNIAQLRLHLQQQGVQLAEFTVDINDDRGREGGRETGDGARGRSLHNPDQFSGDDEETPLFRVDLEQGLLHWMA